MLDIDTASFRGTTRFIKFVFLPFFHKRPRTDGTKAWLWNQDGFLKNAQTYEIINPDEVGADSSKIILTARSGRSALAYRFQNLGFVFDRNDIDALYEEFEKVADIKKEIIDSDLKELATAYNNSIAVSN